MHATFFKKILAVALWHVFASLSFLLRSISCKRLYLRFTLFEKQMTHTLAHIAIIPKEQSAESTFRHLRHFARSVYVNQRHCRVFYRFNKSYASGRPPASFSSSNKSCLQFLNLPCTMMLLLFYDSPYHDHLINDRCSRWTKRRQPC